jgi:2-methylcitrate dehydratase PrpD
VQVFFTDGTSTAKIKVEYPIGHRRRRKEGIPLLVEKFKASLRPHYSEKHAQEILGMFEEVQKLEKMPVNEFVQQFIPPKL